MGTRQKKEKGFSLVEMLVYMAVFLLIASALVITFLSFDTTLIRNKTERVLAQEARVGLEHMLLAIRHADSVDTVLSTLDTSPGELILEGDETIRFYLSGGILIMEVDGETLGPITSDAVTVEDITFNYQSSAATDVVRIELELSSVTKAASTTRTFNAGAILRGTYE
jgi:prepilin-type N-terminal cleavage/methylation domain-containing protein